MLSEAAAPASKGIIPLCVPEIRGNEWKYIKECLDTNWVSSVGSFVDRFERVVAEYVGTKYAVATINGTSALHVALLVAGVQPEDEVLVSSLSFIAPANAIRYAGAWPVFMDAEPAYWQMDPAKVEAFLENECRWQNGRLTNKSTSRRVTAVLPVHILGHPCDMDPILDLARKYKLATIEDASESLGARYRGRMVGRLGDIACLSFNGNKLITTGGGGMIVTENQQWAERARYLTTQARDDPVEYVHNEIGFNYRLSNIQAAMGVAQMEQIDDFISKKRQIARVYQDGFKDVSEITPMPAHEAVAATYWLYTVLLQAQTTLSDRKTVLSELNEAAIGARPLWQPLHTLPPYIGSQAYRIEHSVRLYERGVSLPSSVGLKADGQQKCINVLKNTCRIHRGDRQ
jgi:perosamine synthetase